MSQTQEPSLPAASKDPEQQRLLTGVSDLVRTLLRQGVFLARSVTERALSLGRASGDRFDMKWGAFNRVKVAGTHSDCMLPRIEARWIGVPLYFAKTDADGINSCLLYPTGTGLDGRTAPLINDGAFMQITSVGLFVLMTDGNNWFCNMGP